MSDDVAWESLALSLMDLLDLIETQDELPYPIHEICHSRFALAEQHGLTVEMTGEPISGVMQ